MTKCVHHPGRESAQDIGQQHYCSNCVAGIVSARRSVHQHVEPKACFVWYVGAGNWQPITGTGCAHWVAHRLGILSEGAQEQCLSGYIYRVATLIRRTIPVPISNIRVNDIYISPRSDHTGLVIRITPAPPQRPGQPQRGPQIIIRHDSSRLGRVADSDYATYFNGEGTFRRLPTVVRRT